MDKGNIVLDETNRVAGETKKTIKVADDNLNVVEKKGSLLTITLGDKASFKDTLPEELKTKEAIKVVEGAFKHTKNFIDNSVEAAMDAVEKAFKENKEVDVVNVQTPFGMTGSGVINTTVQRATKVNVPGGTPYKGPSTKVEVRHAQLMPSKTAVSNRNKALREALNS